MPQDLRPGIPSPTFNTLVLAIEWCPLERHHSNTTPQPSKSNKPSSAFTSPNANLRWAIQVHRLHRSFLPGHGNTLGFDALKITTLPTLGNLTTNYSTFPLMNLYASPATTAQIWPKKHHARSRLLPGLMDTQLHRQHHPLYQTTTITRGIPQTTRWPQDWMV